ncbi:MAG TPA: glycogen debranching N-terminal domain-containing protein [Candidatus Limnocylindrales bacterium]|nr:glycogen debranching N-terminal domain-containing protein [Candidatus Limnocylindrales bacterium]
MAQPLVDRADAATTSSPKRAPATTSARSAPAQLPPPSPVIVAATDLGGVGVLKHGNLYLLSDPFGDIHPDSRGLGLYDLDTRVLSCAVLRINGVRPTLLRTQATANHIATIQLTNPELRRDPGIKNDIGAAIASRAISIMRRRWIAGGLAERIEVTNYSAAPQRVELDLELDADSADIFEVRGRVRERRGTYLPTQATDDSITFAYEGLDGFIRRTLVSMSPAVVMASSEDDSLPKEGSVRVRWSLEIEPGSRQGVSWEVSTQLAPGPHAHATEEAPTRLAQSVTHGTPATEGANGAGSPIAPPTEAEAEYGTWQERCARIRSDGELLDLAIRRSIADLRLLRNDGPMHGEHYLAAGVPWFTTLFGRDSIITSLQVLPFMPDVARETLRVLAAWQATEDDPDRDMEPGKILHELRTGELARTGELPHRPYYGSIDATPLWLILLDETYRWTGDIELVRSLWPNAIAALEWIDRYGDRDGDGFVEYERRTPKGLLNQGWKDSGDAIRHRDGTPAEAPIALVEIQGYVYDAKRRMASLAERLGDRALSKHLLVEAAELEARFNEAFWMPDLSYYAMALDRDKRQVGGIGSNAGHCLWSGIVPPDRVDAVVDRLLDPSMDCGWGIRTYASGQPGYNPVGYHTGTVWPHDNAIIAAGMKRVGRHDAADRIASRIFEAAQHSPDFRLPELFCGFDRGLADVPVPYPVACSPQAWAAATSLSLLQTMLGMHADAANDILELDRPHLPSWLGKVTVHDLRVGERTVDLLFHRWRGNTTSAEVLRRDGPLELVIRV